MQVAPLERGTWHLLPEQNPSAQSESPIHSTQMLLSQSDLLGWKVQSESARHCTHFSLLTLQTPSRPRALTLHSSDDVQVEFPRGRWPGFMHLLLLLHVDCLGWKVQSVSERHCTHSSLFTSQTPSRPRVLKLHSSDDVHVRFPGPSWTHVFCCCKMIFLD